MSSTPGTRHCQPAHLPPYIPPPPPPSATVTNLRESTVIETLLQKYDSLQRISDSWGFSSENSLWGFLDNKQVMVDRQEEVEWTGDGRGLGQDVANRGTLDDFTQDLTNTENYCRGESGRKWNCGFRTCSEDLQCFIEDKYNSFPAHKKNIKSDNLENGEIVKQTSLFFGLNLVSLPPLLCLLHNTLSVTGRGPSPPS